MIGRVDLKLLLVSHTHPLAERRIFGERFAEEALGSQVRNSLQ
jgi:hypothetical protein